MPELKNEVPSREELVEYLDIHFRDSLIGDWKAGHEIAGDFAQLAYDKLLDGLLRLNQLPREDPFWHNTNLRPTFYKLPEFGRLLLAADPADAGAWWIFAIMAPWTAQNHFGQEAWLALHKLGGLDPRWPVYAAMITNEFANHTAEQLVEYLRQAGSMDASATTLREIAAGTGGRSAAWATRTLELLRGSG